MDLRGWSGAVRFGLPGLILGLALSWWIGGRGLLAQVSPTTTTPGSDRSRPAPGGDSSGTIAFTTNVGGPTAGTQLLYLIDTKSRAFAIYRVDASSSSKGAVKLEAARQYQWDLKLSHYNNLGPMPTEIETAVRAGGPTTKR